MRSGTLVTLAEFGEFLGIDPYLLAQVDYDGDNVNRLKDNACEVFVEYPYQKIPNPKSNSHMGWLSRDMLRSGLQSAERLFEAWTGLSPAPRQVMSEYHKYKPTFNQRVPYSIKPTIGRIIQPGIWTYTATNEGDVTLTRESGDTLLDFFTTTFTVPIGTNSDDVLVYLTATDGGYSGTPKQIHEIRPVEITISGTDATLRAPAYLFVKPEHYEKREPDRLEHTAETYVSAVAVYVRSVDDCQHGYYTLEETALDKMPSSTRPFYLTVDVEQHNDYVVAQQIECVDGVKKRYSNSKRIIGHTIHYIAGYELVDRQVDPTIKNIICKIASALLKIDWNDNELDRLYGCNGLFLPTLRMYQDVPQTQTADPMALRNGSTTGGRFDIIVPMHVRSQLNGRPILQGIVEAYADCIDLNILR